MTADHRYSLCIGTGDFVKGMDVAKIVLNALNTGFRAYEASEENENEDQIGSAMTTWMSNGCHQRKELDITSNWNCTTTGSANTVVAALHTSLRKLKTDYVDSYLIQSPLAVYEYPLGKAWEEFCSTKTLGLARTIGVSNFPAQWIWTLCNYCEYNHLSKPSINQLEYHPYVAHKKSVRDTLVACKENGIAIETYGAFTSLSGATDGPVDQIVKDIATVYGVSEEEILLSWAYQHSGGISVIITSEIPQCQGRYLDVFQRVQLTPFELEAISQAGSKLFYRGNYQKVWDDYDKELDGN